MMMMMMISESLPVYHIAEFQPGPFAYAIFLILHHDPRLSYFDPILRYHAICSVLRSERCRELFALL